YKWMEWAKNEAKNRGLDIFSPNADSSTTNKTGMSGGIERITQSQADVLAGQVGGIHMAVVQANDLRRQQMERVAALLSLTREGLLIQLEISANTSRTANNTDRLVLIEKYLYNIDKKMSSDAPLRA